MHSWWVEYADGSCMNVIRMYAIHAESSCIIRLLDICCPIGRVGSSADARKSHVKLVVPSGSRALRVAMISVCGGWPSCV